MKYINGYSDGDDVCFLYKDDGEKKIKRISFDWYFLVDTVSVEKHKNLFQSLKNKSVSIKPYGSAKLINRIVKDKDYPEYTRIYCDRFISPSKKAIRRGEHGVDVYYRSDCNMSGNNIWNLIDSLDNENIKHYEADLTPLQRYMIDNDVKIESKYDECYFDIEANHPETDFNDHEGWHIFSIAWKGSDGKSGFIIADKFDRKSEKKLLQKFLNVMKNYDVFYAWNGDGFDFPVIWERCALHGLKVEWRKFMFVDLMSIFKKYYDETEAKVSFSLDNISKIILGRGKLKLNVSIMELYRKNKELLRKYNKEDVNLMYEINAKTGFSKLDQSICMIGNCFIHDPYIQSKVDGYLLKLANSKGIHYATKRKRSHNEDRYEGAYVMEPDMKLHNGVSLFDFKALYPSIMIAFNISPETFVSKADLKSNKGLIKTPTDSYFSKINTGIFPLSFGDTTDRRKKYQDMIKKSEVNSEQYKLYKNLANAYKILGLSFYGALGAPFSRYYNTEMAYAVTGSGQYFMKAIVDFFEDENYRVIYGDTDSVFVKIKQSKCKKILVKAQKYLNRLVKKFDSDISENIVTLEYESYFKRIFFISKKRYAGVYDICKGVKTDEMEIKGLESIRSDGSRIMRVQQRKFIKRILKKNLSIDSYKLLLEKLKLKVINHKLKLEDIVISQSISKKLSEYKTKLAHVKIAEWMIDNGYEVYVGMKIPYIVVKSKPIQAIHPDIYEGNYDFDYYWNNKIYPPILRILEVVFPEEDWESFIIDNKKRRGGFFND